MKMDDLSDLAPQMAAGASPEVFHQLGMITRQLHDTLTQLGVMPKLQIAADGLPDARSRLNYIADKTGKLMPADPARQWETLQWLHFQTSAIGPMFGQVGWFYKFEGKDIEDKRPLQRYVDEAKRLFGILDARLHGRRWIMDDDYTIADIAIVGMVRNFVSFYEAGDLVGYDSFTNVKAWFERMMARPAVERGLTIPAKPDAK